MERASTSSDGKTVNLNLSVKTVNNTGGVISNKQMGALATERANALNSTIGGVDSQGRTVNVSVTYNDKATMVWEYNMGIEVSKSNMEGRTMEQVNAEASVASGWTDDVGNTQVNRTQINLALPFTNSWDSNGQLTIDNPATREVISSTGVHEDGHTLGGRHETDPNISPVLQAIQQAQPSSLMNIGGPGSNVSPQQRTDFIKRVGEQQQ